MCTYIYNILADSWISSSTTALLSGTSLPRVSGRFYNPRKLMLFLPEGFGSSLSLYLSPSASLPVCLGTVASLDNKHNSSAWFLLASFVHNGFVHNVADMSYHLIDYSSHARQCILVALLL